MPVYTVRSLKDALESLPDDTLVILSRDEEGNGFSQLGYVGFDKADPKELYPIHPYDYNEEEYPDAIDIVVLWP